MTTDELIEKFGGREVVMAVTGAHRNAVNNWRRDGVPYKHWPVLMEAAEREGIHGVTFEELRGTRPSAEAA